MKLYPVFN